MITKNIHASINPLTNFGKLRIFYAIALVLSSVGVLISISLRFVPVSMLSYNQRTSAIFNLSLYNSLFTLIFFVITILELFQIRKIEKVHPELRKTRFLMLFFIGFVISIIQIVGLGIPWPLIRSFIYDLIFGSGQNIIPQFSVELIIGIVSIIFGSFHSLLYYTAWSQFKTKFIDLSSSFPTGLKNEYRIPIKCIKIGLLIPIIDNILSLLISFISFLIFPPDPSNLIFNVSIIKTIIFVLTGVFFLFYGHMKIGMLMIKKNLV